MMQTYQTVGRVEVTSIGEGHRLHNKPQRSSPFAAMPLAGEFSADAVDLHKNARLTTGIPHKVDVVSIGRVEVYVKHTVRHGEVNIHKTVLLVTL